MTVNELIEQLEEIKKMHPLAERANIISNEDSLDMEYDLIKISYCSMTNELILTFDI
jgi:hypothetical protein